MGKETNYFYKPLGENFASLCVYLVYNPLITVDLKINAYGVRLVSVNVHIKPKCPAPNGSQDMHLSDGS